MAETESTFLCGGVLFFMVMKAVYPDGSARDHRQRVICEIVVDLYEFKEAEPDPMTVEASGEEETEDDIEPEKEAFQDSFEDEYETFDSEPVPEAEPETEEKKITVIQHQTNVVQNGDNNFNLTNNGVMNFDFGGSRK